MFARRCLPAKVAFSLAILLTLIFSKYIYMSSITSYYTFYLISKFHLPVQNAQIRLFIFLCLDCRGHPDRRSGRRPHRPQVCHLGFDHRGTPVHLASALCQSVLDGHSYGFDRLDPVFGVFGDSGLCAGVDSRKGWHDLRVVLWFRLWRGGAWLPPCWENSPIRPASISSIECAPSCRQSACSPTSCQIWNRSNCAARARLQKQVYPDANN